VKHAEQYSSPHQERKRKRRERLKKVLLEEGAELPNKVILARFPWAGESLIRAIRKEIGVRPPGSKYRRQNTTEEDQEN